jgi:hypothetical protein
MPAGAPFSNQTSLPMRCGWVAPTELHCDEPAWGRNVEAATFALWATHNASAAAPKRAACTLAFRAAWWQLLPNGFDSLIGLSGGAFERSAQQYPYYLEFTPAETNGTVRRSARRRWLAFVRDGRGGR